MSALVNLVKLKAAIKELSNVDYAAESTTGVKCSQEMGDRPGLLPLTI